MNGLPRAPKTNGEIKRRDAQTKASARAEERAFMKRKTDMTSERMFFGAFVNAYSRPVMDARISENAMSTYLCGSSVCIINKKKKKDERAGLDPHIQRGGNLEAVLVEAGRGMHAAGVSLRVGQLYNILHQVQRTL
jgi:hypothetical protein